MTFPDDIVTPEERDPHDFEILTRIPQAALSHQLKLLGSDYPETLIGFREKTLAGLAWFPRFIDQVFIPVAGLPALRERLMEEQGLPHALIESYRKTCPAIVPALVTGAWAVEKICVAFEGSLAGALIEDLSAWEETSCDWVVEHFRPFSFFLKLPPGQDGKTDLGGNFIGLTAREDGPVLYIQYVLPNGMAPLHGYFEFPLKRGMTLGDMLVQTEYDHFAFDALAALVSENDKPEGSEAGEDKEDTETAGRGFTPEEFRSRMTALMHEAAGCAFPLVVALLSGRYAMTTLRINAPKEEIKDLGGSIPVCGLRRDHGILFRSIRAQTVTVVLVHDGEPAATDAPAFVTDSSQAAGEEGGEGDGEESPLWKALLADAADAMETPLCELDAITNFHGEGFASYIAFLRRQALHDYPWFREAGGTAFCPLTTVLVDQADEENLDFGPDEVLATAVGIWAIEKICISYTLEVLYDAMQSRDWWHGYTCDWVLEHFTSWALWLQLPGSGGNPNVDPMNASGYLAGLTANEEGYSIWFQHLEDETDLTTSDFFEVPLIPGKTLGEIFENVQFGHFDFEPVEDEDVIDQAGDGDDEEKDSDGFDFDEVDLRVSELAEVALPLLVIAIGDEHARTVLRTDRTCTRTELIPGATLPRRGVIDVRGTAGTGSDEFRRAVTGDEILYIRMEKDIRRDLN